MLQLAGFIYLKYTHTHTHTHITNIAHDHYRPCLSIWILLKHRWRKRSCGITSRINTVLGMCEDVAIFSFDNFLTSVLWRRVDQVIIWLSNFTLVMYYWAGGHLLTVLSWKMRIKDDSSDDDNDSISRTSIECEKPREEDVFYVQLHQCIS